MQGGGEERGWGGLLNTLVGESWARRCHRAVEPPASTGFLLRPGLRRRHRAVLLLPRPRSYYSQRRTGVFSS